MTKKQPFVYLLLFLFWSAECYAHGPIKGIGDFYNGVLHPFFVPTHLLLLISIGLLVGQRGVDSNVRSFLAFVMGIVLGLLFSNSSLQMQMDLILLIPVVLIGGLVAVNVSINSYLIAALSLFAGFLVGFDSPQDALSDNAIAVGYLGLVTGAFLLFFNAIGLADFAGKFRWAAIGVRVMGSWTLSISLLMLVFSFEN